MDRLTLHSSSEAQPVGWPYEQARRLSHSKLILIPYGVKPAHDENCLGIKLRQRRIKSAHPCIYPKADWNALT